MKNKDVENEGIGIFTIIIIIVVAIIGIYYIYSHRHVTLFDGAKNNVSIESPAPVSGKN